MTGRPSDVLQAAYIAAATAIIIESGVVRTTYDLHADLPEAPADILTFKILHMAETMHVAAQGMFVDNVIADRRIAGSRRAATARPA